MKNDQEENRCRKQPADQGLYRLLENVDVELAEAVRSQGCVFCAEGKLHRADYDRKPRAGPEHWNERHSFCCDQEGCRRRHTPPSVRFLGRKVWVGFVVVLQTALHQGLNAARLAQWRTVLPQIDRRTVERWRQWWQEHVLATPFWKIAQAHLTPPLSPGHLPRELGERFLIDTPEGLGKLLRFLSPLSTVSRVAAGAM